MAMVIRTLYNNQDWQAPCRNPGRDVGCWLCYRDNVAIKPPAAGDEVCTGQCWEELLRRNYRWGCTPKGRVFGSRTHAGTRVFFVFKEPDGTYTLWGRATARSVDDKPVEPGGDGDEGYAFVRFDAFEPLPREKWARNLRDVDLVGEKWLMGRYRYVGADHEAYLNQLLEGLVPQGVAVAARRSSRDICIGMAPSTYDKLEHVANVEGRQVDEIMREAIAEWLRGREK